MDEPNERPQSSAAQGSRVIQLPPLLVDTKGSDSPKRWFGGFVDRDGSPAPFDSGNVHAGEWKS